MMKEFDGSLSLLCVQVTKIFSKKKTGITYNFKSSLTLCGMQVYLFETSRQYLGHSDLFSPFLSHSLSLSLLSFFL